WTVCVSRQPAPDLCAACAAGRPSVCNDSFGEGGCGLSGLSGRVRLARGHTHYTNTNYFLGLSSLMISATMLSMVSLMRLSGRLKLFDRMENATRSPWFVMAYPDSVLTPPREPVFA